MTTNKRRAERRQTHCVDARTQAACGTRHGVRRLAPPSACGRARPPAFHLRFSPAGLSSRGLSFGPGFPKTAPKRGHSRQRCPRSQRCTSRASLFAGRHDARAARVRTVSFRPRAPRSLRRRGVPSSKASLKSETAAVNYRHLLVELLENSVGVVSALSHKISEELSVSMRRVRHRVCVERD